MPRAAMHQKIAAARRVTSALHPGGPHFVRPTLRWLEARNKSPRARSQMRCVDIQGAGLEAATPDNRPIAVSLERLRHSPVARVAFPFGQTSPEHVMPSAVGCSVAGNTSALE